MTENSHIKLELWGTNFATMEKCEKAADKLVEKGYRRQINGEWERIEVNGENYGQVYYQHKNCSVNETQIFPSPYPFCPNCGAKMKGGAE